MYHTNYVPQCAQVCLHRCGTMVICILVGFYDKNHSGYTDAPASRLYSAKHKNIYYCYANVIAVYIVYTHSLATYFTDI